MLKREVDHSRVEEDEGPCIHSELTNGSLAFLLLMALLFGAVFGGMLMYGKGYGEGYRTALPITCKG